jgi:hypothetical protein
MIGRPHAQPLLRRNNAYRAVAVSLPSAKSGNIRRWQKLRSAGARRPSYSPKMRRGGTEEDFQSRARKSLQQDEHSPTVVIFFP